MSYVAIMLQMIYIDNVFMPTAAALNHIYMDFDNHNVF